MQRGEGVKMNFANFGGFLVELKMTSCEFEKKLCMFGRGKEEKLAGCSTFFGAERKLINPYWAGFAQLLGRMKSVQ